MPSDRELAPDWILKQALEAQTKANQDWVPPGPMRNGKYPIMSSSQDSAGAPDNGLTLTVLGCGTMGIAVLGGVMDSLSAANKQASTSGENVPSRIPTRFNACTRRPASAKRIESELGHHEAFKHCSVRASDNLQATRDADVILLACKPWVAKEIFSSQDVRDACKGKLILSILAGVPESQLRELVGLEADDCTIVRVMPNTAAAVRESMTVIAEPSTPMTEEQTKLVTWIFERVGRVLQLPAATMDACTSLCGSGPAFALLVMEGMAAGGIAMGIHRDYAYTMAAQAMRGATALVLQGEHPAVLKDKVTTPGGCTIGGLLTLEEGGVTGHMARAVREATVVASQLGQGKSNVNGTRH